MREDVALCCSTCTSCASKAPQDTTSSHGHGQGRSPHGAHRPEHHGATERDESQKQLCACGTGLFHEVCGSLPPSQPAGVNTTNTAQ
ncbi:hypothetical protein NHX12_002382 [Muraenolepis orangiensis]|uniref:Uncharacterized protein n=1 Tax=Muraenolepis orangiensis TaxID=630683 RepID=A0A9Q0DX49_9TELE|nr:hypothetical protein NHX12_002382 [Muraenolepis orangiensis]